MKKVLLAGATGNLGRHLLSELKQQGYNVKVLARSAHKAEALTPLPDEVLLADATKPETLTGCCEGVALVISAIGKSLSLKDKSNAGFHAIDFSANYNLLQEAKTAGVPQFIYISAFTAEQHPELAYFKAHADFSDALVDSGLNYVILQPTALFSTFEEIVAMARKGRVSSLGAGDKLTNPIYEGDVAKVAVESIGIPSQFIPLGGQKVYSRLQLLHIACKAARYDGRIRGVPFAVVDAFLPAIRFFSRNLFDKLAFIVAVSKVDCVAPQVGELSLEDYFEITPMEKAGT